MSRLRARVAERLLQPQANNAILTTFNEGQHGAGDGDAQALPGALREGARHQDRLHELFVKAAVHALKKFPIINASVDGNDIVYHGYFDIGIAVGSPRGLVVPILRNADQMSFADIEKKIAEFGQKARDGKLARRPDRRHVLDQQRRHLRLDASTPIINPPQSAILGVHATNRPRSG